jgi:hypothetical protein
MEKDIQKSTFERKEQGAEKELKNTELTDSLKLEAGEYFIEKLSREEKELLKETNDIRLAAALWENRQLKGENAILKRNAPTNAPQLDSRGNAENNDPFTAGFIGAMNEF